jgi:hypothetical protein
MVLQLASINGTVSQRSLLTDGAATNITNGIVSQRSLLTDGAATSINQWNCIAEESTDRWCCN